MLPTFLSGMKIDGPVWVPVVAVVAGMVIGLVLCLVEPRWSSPPRATFKRASSVTHTVTVPDGSVYEMFVTGGGGPGYDIVAPGRCDGCDGFHMDDAR
jgi:hypothetical protein